VLPEEPEEDEDEEEAGDEDLVAAHPTQLLLLHNRGTRRPMQCRLYWIPHWPGG